MLIEAAVTIAFVGFAAFALMTNPLLIPLGYIAHAGWDWAHHSPLFDVSMPRWYIPACVVVDIVMGVGLWTIWLAL